MSTNGRQEFGKVDEEVIFQENCEGQCNETQASNVRIFVILCVSSLFLVIYIFHF